jgi:hypothetical protein
MKNVFIVFLFFSLCEVESQVVFCPPGANWHYTFYYWMAPESRNEQVKYVKDSVMGTDVVKVLLHNNYYNHCNYSTNVYSLIKQKGDTVFMRNAATKHTWQILYNFSAQAGQSWTTTVNTFWNVSQSLTYSITVDSVNYVTINNFVLKELFVKYQYTGSTFQENAIITERFGCNKYLFNYKNPDYCSDGEYPEYFLCYFDSTFGLKQFTEKPCDYKDYVGIGDNSYLSTRVKIYPNPANEFIVIGTNPNHYSTELIREETLLSIKDLCGREIKQATLGDLNSKDIRIDISDLKNGIYLLNLQHNGREIYTVKLVKNN